MGGRSRSRSTMKDEPCHSEYKIADEIVEGDPEIENEENKPDQCVEEKPTLEKVLWKLDKLLDENIRLREQNDRLNKRIDALEKLLNNQNVSPDPLPTSPSQPAAAASQPPAKARFDMLLLSDSMFRHVAADNPNPPC